MDPVERMHKAVEVLATTPGRIKDRLELTLIQCAPLQPNDFPESLRGEYEQVLKAYQELTMRTERQAISVAKRLFRIYVSLINHDDNI